MLNVVVLMGRLSQTPEVKKGKDGKEFVVGTIAVPNGLNPDGSEATMFVDYACYNSSQTAFDYCDKGDQICISGKLDVYKYARKDGTQANGVRVVVNTIEFGSKKYSGEEAEEAEPAPAPAPAPTPAPAEAKAPTTRRPRK